MARSTATRLRRREAKAAPLLTCDASGCERIALHRAVLHITPSRSLPHVPHPTGLVLCEEHRQDFPSAEVLLETIDGLWDAIVEGLRASGRVPLAKLSRLDWEPCGPLGPAGPAKMSARAPTAEQTTSNGEPSA